MPQALRTGDPQKIGDYRLVGLLGEGGQGAVYRGEAPRGEPVAIKLLHARFSGDAKARARFAAELAHARRVAPFCTARVLDADLDGDRPYIVSEFVEGPTLSDVIASGPPPEGSALERIAIATVTALAAIHEAGVVHRDFKPGNVIMGPGGPRVIDFGIARALDATGTLSSAVVGTPAYMAPEQIAGGAIGPAADIFAWGCAMAFAASGVTLFGQDSIPAVMHRILHEEPDLGRLATPLREIVAACLAKEPDRRPSARQILLRLLGGAESAVTPKTLLTEGARISASPPGPRNATRPWPPGDPSSPAYGPTQRAYGPAGQAYGPGQPVAVRGGTPRSHRALTRAMGVAAVVLGVTTLLPWAHVGRRLIGTSVPIDVVGVSGLRTLWGVLILVMAVIAVNLAIIDEFSPRLSAVWAAVPGGVTIVSIAGFVVRRQDLLSKHPNFGLLSVDDLHKMGYALDISLSPGVYAALAAAVVLTALALLSRR
ncbi:serine/threonine-protein kinase [Actinoallomurus sp. CA-142502]|uniref:serine/threonine-protein kinase n=1 Tax=Actinoallomurus sp. CA-142502 TaxID=3239885 RepID=UPI003D920644